MKFLSVVCLGAVAPFALAQPGGGMASMDPAPAGTQPPVVMMDIPDTANVNGSFNTLIRALQAAELVDALKAPGPFTVFAPTDDAFVVLPPGLLDCLIQPENKEILSGILTYHVVEGAIMSSELTDGPVETLNGATVMIDLTNGVMVNSATVTTPDVMATNGIIHIIDSVLVPPDTDVAGFLATCTDAPIVGATEPPMEGTMPPDMTTPPVEDTMPPMEGTMPPDASMPPMEGSMPPGSAEDDIPAAAMAAGMFQDLVTALTVTDLVGALSEPEGPFTVFAPSDDAFDELPMGILDCLLKEENKGVLSDILTYHVVEGSIMSTDLVDGMEAPTLNGANITFTVDSGVMVENATVVTPDIEASNGVIHVIDSVLIPPDVDVSDLENCDIASNVTLAPTEGDEDQAGDSSASAFGTMGGILGAIGAALFAAM